MEVLEASTPHSLALRSTADLDSFGGSGGTITGSGRLYMSRLTSGTFPTPQSGGKIVMCTDGSGNIVGFDSLGWTGISGKPTTLSGYGITDSQPFSTSLGTISSGSGTLNFSNFTLSLPADVSRLGSSIDFGSELSGKPITVSGYGITDALTKGVFDANNDGKIDSAALSSVLGVNGVIVSAGTNAVANGNALKDAYTQACGMSPSASNRITVLVLPGTYDLNVSDGQAGLTMNTQYVDLSGVGSRDNVRITSGGRTIAQTANDVEIANCTLVTTSQNGSNGDNSDDAAYFPNSNLPLAKLTNVVCKATGAYSHRIFTQYSGIYRNCTAGDYGFAGWESTFSGVAVDCIAGFNSFGGEAG
jgi:hypothetical protein